jgi:hypothetical protein
MSRFRNANPYLDRLAQLPAYGRFDSPVLRYLAEVSLDPEEEVIASVKCNHGQGKVGHLAITTHRLRWFQRLLTKTHDHWPLAITVVLQHRLPPVIALASGDLFQSRSLNPRAFKDFVGLHQQLLEALRWDSEHADAEPVRITATPSVQGPDVGRRPHWPECGLRPSAAFPTAKRQLGPRSA